MPLTKDKYFELIDSNSDYPHFRCALGAYIPGSLYKYFSIPDDSDEARKRFEQLKSGEIWFSKRSGLNDPFEFEHIALKGAQNDARQYYLNKQQELEVCCFSALLYNKLMWSHYAAGYKGYCVEFRVESPERFYPVIYENEVPDLSQEYQRFYDMRNEMCANPSLVLNNYENRKVLLRINYPLFSKDTCWSYEEEYRILDSSTVSNGKFAEALQTGLAESLADRPQKVDTQLFVGRTLVDANGEQVHVTQDLANAIYEDLIQNDYVKRGKLTDKYFADKEIGSFHVASEVSGYADSVVRILSGVYDAHTMAPENAHSNNVQAIVDEEKLHKAEFLNLWNRINHKSFYTVQFDTPELIDHSIRALDSKLNVTRVQINLEYGEQTARLESREQLEQGKGFQKARSDRESAKYAPLGSVRYDLVGKLVEETGLTRATVAAILRGIAPQTFSQFRINPEEFILKAARLINDEKATQIIEHITYNRLDAAYDQDVFTRATLRGKLDVNAMEANRSLYSHVIYDSDNERRFAQELDVSDQVAVYVKLPGSFYISTPVGKYNPDWAIAFNEGSVKHIYFVAETKGNLDTMELRGVENAKIECAKKHFAAISNGSVVYSVVDNYSTLMQLVSN